MDTCPKRLNVIAEKVKIWKVLVVWGEGKHSHIFILFEEKAGILKLIEWWEGVGGIFTLFDENADILTFSHCLRRRRAFSHYLSWETLWSVWEEDTRKRDDPRLSTSFSPLFLVGEPGLGTFQRILQVFATMFLLITQLVICKHLLFCPASLAVDMYQHTRFCFIDFFSFWT